MKMMATSPLFSFWNGVALLAILMLGVVRVPAQMSSLSELQAEAEAKARDIQSKSKSRKLSMKNDSASTLIEISISTDKLEAFHARIASELEAAQVRGAAYAFRGPVRAVLVQYTTLEYRTVPDKPF